MNTAHGISRTLPQLIYFIHLFACAEGVRQFGVYMIGMPQIHDGGIFLMIESLLENEINMRVLYEVFAEVFYAVRSQLEPNNANA